MLALCLSPLLMAVSCTSVRPSPDSSAAAQAVITDTAPALTLSRGSCYGTCPIYSVRVYADGRIAFLGTRFVRQTGADTGRVTPAAVRALLLEFEARNFTQVAPRIEAGGKGCGDEISDLPSNILSMHTSAVDHTVRYSQGCSKYPRMLDTLSGLVDTVAGTHRWTTPFTPQRSAPPREKPE
jgi:Domain of unknown function (DUF6438)